MSITPFNLLPDDTDLTPDEDLQAAAANALDTPSSVTPSVDQQPEPIGRTFLFDYETGQMVRSGSSPARAHGFATIEQWCLMALHTTRFASAVFSDEFGMEDPDEPLGEFAVGEILADWEAHLIEALLVHDRITAIENVSLTWDPSEGILYLDSFDVVTDEEQTITLGDIAIQRSIS